MLGAAHQQLGKRQSDRQEAVRLLSLRVNATGKQVAEAQSRVASLRCKGILC
jgi:hypothetical protein